MNNVTTVSAYELGIRLDALLVTARDLAESAGTPKDRDRCSTLIELAMEIGRELVKVADSAPQVGQSESTS